MSIRSILLAGVLVLIMTICKAVSSSATGPKGESNNTLTWIDKSTAISNPDSKEVIGRNVTFFWNGVAVGDNLKGLMILERLQLPEYARVRIVIPPDSGLFKDPDYQIPLTDTPLIKKWFRDHVQMQWYFGQRKLDTHYLSWTNYDGGSDMNEAVIWLDGKSLGKRDEAIPKLKKVMLKNNSLVLMLTNWFWSSSGPPYMPPFWDDEFIDNWKNQGAHIQKIVESLAGKIERARGETKEAPSSK